MGVYINGMELPTHCMDCPFMVTRDNDDCILQSDEANENFENWEQMKAGCPLIELPPHGRLIDADALLKKAYDSGQYANAEEGFHQRVVDVEDIDDAPTIIEAEGTE